MKRTFKKLAIILAMVIGVATCGCSSKTGAELVNSVNDEKIVNSAYDEKLSIPMFVEFEDELEDENATAIDPTEKISFDNVIGQANEETLAIIDNCKKKIIDYFAKRNLDVAPQIAALENIYIYQSEVLNDLYVAGYYKPDSFDVYLNQEILSDEDYLRFTYIHEVMHYLGFSDSESIMLQEGMADALTEDILGYAYSESYDIPRCLCHQMLISDPDLISYILEGGDIDNRIDIRLKNVPRKWLVEEHNLPLSNILDVLLCQIEYAEELGIDNNSKEVFINQCQAIVLAYCGTFDITEIQMVEINDYLIYFDNKF